MKELIELIKSIKDKIESHNDKLSKNETLTRYVIIDPLLKHLGWDISNPDEVITEYGLENKFSDYTIFNDKSKPYIVIEAKALNKSLEDKTKMQIGNYIGNSPARFVIFTNGTRWVLFDFYITHIDHQDERIVLDININSEPENLSSLKFLCISKENLLSKNPFFINQKNSPLEYRDSNIVNSKQAIDIIPLKNKAEPNYFEEAKVKGSKVQLRELVEHGLLKNNQILFFYSSKTYRDERAEILPDENKLRYVKDGNTYSITALARKLLKTYKNINYDNVQGPLYWKTEDGRLLDDLNKQIRKSRNS